MNRDAKVAVKCFVIGIISFIMMLSALIQIPRLQDINTCVSAAFIITLAYAWFVVLIYVNIILPITKK